MPNPLRWFAAAPRIAPITDTARANRLYRHLRLRNLYAMMIGYAVFYFVRKNFSMAMPVFLSDLGYTKTDLGIILTLFSVVYGIGKFVNGVLADRANARYMMAIALLCSAVVNVCFGFSSGLVTFGVLWLLNAWFQSYGMPASVRLLTRWYSSSELGTTWGIQSTAHQIGGAGIMVLAGFLIPQYGWRSAFYVPAAIAIVTAFWLLNRLRDTPESVGLPAVEVYRGEAETATNGRSLPFKTILLTHILRNGPLWVVVIANIFVYVVRVGIMDWAPTFLVESRGSSLASAGLKTAGFELAGMAGSIGMGWLSDTLFKGLRGRLAAISMLALAIALFGLWWLPPTHPILDTVLLIAAGMLVYGPQVIVPVAAADFASKQAACTATGLTGASGYVGAALTGVGTGVVVDTWGWSGGFLFFIGASVIGALLFALLWNRRAAQVSQADTTEAAA